MKAISKLIHTSVLWWLGKHRHYHYAGFDAAVRYYSLCFHATLPFYHCLFGDFLFPRGKPGLFALSTDSTVHLTCHPLVRLSVAVIWVTGEVQRVQGADAAGSVWTETQRQRQQSDIYTIHTLRSPLSCSLQSLEMWRCSDTWEMDRVSYTTVAPLR